MSYASEVLADSPVGYWPFDDTSGSTAVDSSGNSHNGTYVNSPTLNATKLISVGSAVTFNGSNQFCTIFASDTSALHVGNKLTLEAWIKTNVTTGFAEIIDSDSSGVPSGRWFQFRLDDPSGKLSWVLFDNAGAATTVIGNTSVADNVKHHVVAAYDGSTVKLYIDGALDKSQTISLTINTTCQAVNVASHVGGGAHNFSGTIDEVAIYAAELSSTRVGVHYNAGNPGNIDLDTLTSKTSVSFSELYAALDSITVPLVTQYSGTEGIGNTYTESATLATKTIVTYTEHGPYLDPVTISTKTTPIFAEEEYIHPTGQWGPFDNDNGFI